MRTAHQIVRIELDEDSEEGGDDIVDDDCGAVAAAEPSFSPVPSLSARLGFRGLAPLASLLSVSGNQPVTDSASSCGPPTPPRLFSFLEDSDVEEGRASAGLREPSPRPVARDTSSSPSLSLASGSRSSSSVPHDDGEDDAEDLRDFLHDLARKRKASELAGAQPSLASSAAAAGLKTARTMADVQDAKEAKRQQREEKRQQLERAKEERRRQKELQKQAREQEKVGISAAARGSRQFVH
jgi:hypothetical protein